MLIVFASIRNVFDEVHYLIGWSITEWSPGWLLFVLE